MKHLFLSLLAILTAGTIGAQTCKNDFLRDPYLAGSNYVAYPGPQTQQHPAPKGYEAVYLSHYGRHGSRYHIGSIYTNTARVLAKADSAGVLTDKGREVLQQVRDLYEEARGRDGELTELGALQHRQIAERMFNNYPSIFNKETHIDAKSTVVIRCILSMENALQQLKSMNPKLDIRHDASEHDMWFMNQHDPLMQVAKDKTKKMTAEYSDSHTHPERLMQLLFTDEAYWQQNVNAKWLMKELFHLAMNVQSSEIRHRINMTGLFTQQELYDLWQTDNAWWYCNFGPSHFSDGIQPYSQRNLLRKIITEADSCLQLDNCGVNLRYGHDTMVMPLVCLLELNNAATDISDLNTLATHEWCDYRIFPMACNVQFVFYRNAKKDILVKVLHNENEAHLPLKTNTWPYYKWNNVRTYYLNKLDAYK